MKAMLLAAGRGYRLRPITDTIPKPLLKIGRHRLIEYNLLKLKACGITDIVINVSYRAEQIIRYLGSGERYGLSISYSFESEGCLGTGGGILQALTLLGKSDPFILMSSDVWSEYQFTDTFLTQNSYAHLVMVPNPHYHPYGDYGMDEQGFLYKRAPKLTYGGIAKIDPRLFNDIAFETFSLSILFNQAIFGNRLTGELYHGPWINVGTLAQAELLRKQLT